MLWWWGFVYLVWYPGRLLRIDTNEGARFTLRFEQGDFQTVTKALKRLAWHKVCHGRGRARGGGERKETLLGLVWPVRNRFLRAWPAGPRARGPAQGPPAPRVGESPVPWGGPAVCE